MSFPLTQNLSRLWASVMIDTLIKKGVTRFYLSPGMRNAPLISAVRAAESLHKLQIIVGYDERAQGMRALGAIKASDQPAAVICTSGSALSHYFPAVIEAYKTGLPLIVLSSDRPMELTLTNANQTIQQDRFFGEYTQYFHNLGAPDLTQTPSMIRSLVAHAVERSLLPTPGPIHLNCPFREPLDQQSDENELSAKGLSQLRLTFAKQVQELVQDNHLKKIVTPKTAPLTAAELESIFKSPKESLIVVGELTTAQTKEAVLTALKENQSLPFIVDVASGLKYDFILNEGSVPSFDHPEVYKAYQNSSLKRIIHIGGRTTSKHYYRFLRENPEIEWLVFQDHYRLHDPAFALTQRIVLPLGGLANSIQVILAKATSQGLPLKIDFTGFVAKKSKLIDEAPLAYPSLSKTIIENFRSDSILWLGNSTVIRSFDSYASETYKLSIRTEVQRGASGIEGSLAGAIGYAETRHKPVVAVIGDISFLHDLNSLTSLQNSQLPLTLIIAQNGGGGIFSLLPAGSDETLHRDLFTAHQVNIKKICQALEVDCERVETPMELKALLQNKRQNKPLVIEALIDDSVNTAIYSELKTIKL